MTGEDTPAWTIDKFSYATVARYLGIETWTVEVEEFTDTWSNRSSGSVLIGLKKEIVTYNFNENTHSLEELSRRTITIMGNS